MEVGPEGVIPVGMRVAVFFDIFIGMSYLGRANTARQGIPTVGLLQRFREISAVVQTRGRRLRGFLGLLHFYGAMVADLHRIVRPLDKGLGHEGSTGLSKQLV